MRIIRRMCEKLPNFIDPIHCAQHNKRFVACVNQSQLPRLAALLVSADQQVAVDIRFYNDKSLKNFVYEVQLKTTLCLECQRTLEPFDFVVEKQVKGVLVMPDALIDALPDDIEIYELSEEKLSLFELVEEELLLSVPMVPIRENSVMPYQNTESDDLLSVESEEVERKPNPFAALKGLKLN